MEIIKKYVFDSPYHKTRSCAACHGEIICPTFESIVADVVPTFRRDPNQITWFHNACAVCCECHRSLVGELDGKKLDELNRFTCDGCADLRDEEDITEVHILHKTRRSTIGKKRPHPVDISQMPLLTDSPSKGVVFEVDDEIPLLNEECLRAEKYHKVEVPPAKIASTLSVCRKLFFDTPLDDDKK
jgi:hypothetical protein